MKESVPTESTIRDYLLGRLDDQTEMEDQLSQPMLFNEQLSDVVDSIEEEIIEDYLDGVLEAADKKAVEDYFLRPPERQEKLKFARDLRDGFKRVHEVQSHADSAMTSVRYWRVRYTAFAALAALLLIFISSCIYITRVRHGLRSQIETGRQAQTLLEEQIAQERQYSAELAKRLEQYEPPVAPLTFVGVYRDIGIPSVEIKPFTQRIKVEINLNRASATAYSVQLLTKGGEEIWSEAGLKPSSGSLGFEMPVQRITSGTYCVVVNAQARYCFQAKAAK